MFVLMSLTIATSLRLLALVAGIDRAMEKPAQQASDVPLRVAFAQQYPLAPIPAPTLRLTI